MNTITVDRCTSFDLDLVQTAAGDQFWAPKKTITLTYNDYRLELVVYQLNHIWLPATYYHRDRRTCPFCGQKGQLIECKQAELQKEDLFEAVLENDAKKANPLFR